MQKLDRFVSRSLTYSQDSILFSITLDASLDIGYWQAYM